MSTNGSGLRAACGRAAGGGACVWMWALCVTVALGASAPRVAWAQATKTEPAQPAPAQPAQPGYMTSETVMLPMADGVKLATDVHRPTNETRKYPALLIRTPYGRAVGRQFAVNLCKIGYVVVSQDMRGRFDSQGKPVPIFANEGVEGEHADGHDTMNWITSQAWSDGKIGTWGGSALGIVQNMAAPSAPPALKGQCVIMAFSDYYHQCAYQGGVWRTELIEKWLQSQKLMEGNYDLFRSHPTYDAFWKKLNTESLAAKVDTPGVYIGGWYDIFLQGTINAFQSVQERGGPNAKGRCYLVIGPVGHGGLSKDVKYPNAIASPINVFAPLNLYEYWLKGAEAGVLGLKPVHYYVMGDFTDVTAPGNRWRSADSWPPPAKDTPLYLHADGTLGLAPPTESDASRTYKFNPEAPVPTLGGQTLFLAKGPVDERPTEARQDVLTFSTEPLKKPTEITGRITAKLNVSSDCPDTDFTVMLCDVYPDGRSMLVTDGIQRASLRGGCEERRPLEAGKTYAIDVDLWCTSIVFNAEHRIRVLVSSSNSPRFEPNPNTGAAHLEPGGATRVATNTLHLSTAHPSSIVLPVYDGGEAGK